MDFPDLPIDSDAANVSFHFEDVAFSLEPEAAVADWLGSIAAAEGRALGELNVIFCSDEHLRGINVEYLDHDYYTDIITFPYDDESAHGPVHGDLFISAERVQDNAASLSVTFEQELCRVMAHGVLHLAGYGDDSDEKKAAMRALEDRYLATAPALHPIRLRLQS